MNTVSKKSLIVFTILLTILISVSIILPISLKKKLDNVEIPEYSNESAYDIAVRHGYTGTKTEWLNSLKGKDKSGVDSIVYLSKENNTDTYAIIYKDGATYTFTVEKGLDATDGENGDKGPKGDKGADGHTPFVYITDDGYWAIDDEITTFPATVDAVDGKSAYDIWKEAGNEGTLKEFLDSLKGVDGLDGDDGLSAYELAKKNGFKGTEEAWLASLIGAKGEKGDAGSKGEAGDKGPTGDKGVTGNKGETGDKGEAGDKGEKGDKGDDATSIIDLKISNQYISKYDNYFTVYTYYLNNGKSFDKVVPIDYPVDYIEEKLYPSCFEIGISHQYAFIKGILTDGSALYFDVTDMVLSQIDLETEGIYDVSINFYNSDRAFSFDTKAYVAEEIYNEDIDVFEDVNYTPKDSAFANLDKFYLYAYSKGNKDRSESARLKFKYSETNPINTFHFVDDDAKNYLVPDGGVSGRFIKLIVDVELLYITITGPKTYIIEDCEFIRETRNACRREDATFMRYADFIYKYRYTPSVNSLANREYTNLGYFHQSDWQELDNYIYDYPIIYFEYQTGLYKMSKDHGFGISYDVEDIQNGTLPGISSHNKQMYTKYLGEFYYLNGEKVEIPDNEQVYNPFIISYNPLNDYSDILNVEFENGLSISSTTGDGKTFFYDIKENTIAQNTFNDQYLTSNEPDYLLFFTKARLNLDRTKDYFSYDNSDLTEETDYTKEYRRICFEINPLDIISLYKDKIDFKTINQSEFTYYELVSLTGIKYTFTREIYGKEYTFTLEPSKINQFKFIVSKYARLHIAKTNCGHYDETFYKENVVNDLTIRYNTDLQHEISYVYSVGIVNRVGFITKYQCPLNELVDSFNIDNSLPFYNVQIDNYGFFANYIKKNYCRYSNTETCNIYYQDSINRTYNLYDKKIYVGDTIEDIFYKYIYFDDNFIIHYHMLGGEDVYIKPNINNLDYSSIPNDFGKITESGTYILKFYIPYNNSTITYNILVEDKVSIDESKITNSYTYTIEKASIGSSFSYTTLLMPDTSNIVTKATLDLIDDPKYTANFKMYISDGTLIYDLFLTSDQIEISGSWITIDIDELGYYKFNVTSGKYLSLVRNGESSLSKYGEQLFTDSENNSYYVRRYYLSFNDNSDSGICEIIMHNSYYETFYIYKKFIKNEDGSIHIFFNDWNLEISSKNYINYSLNIKYDIINRADFDFASLAYKASTCIH